MSQDLPGPADHDGPLFRAAYNRADAVDNATTTAERRGAWARLVPTAVAAFAEGFVRDSMIKGALLFSIIVAIMGATSGEPGWIAGGLAAGLGGAALICVALVRRWSFGRQWAVLLGVLLLDIALMTAYWQTT